MQTIHILGSGTCFPSRLQKGRAYPGFLVEWKSSRLLFECSEGIAKRLEAINIKPDEISHCAISHAHPDHFSLPQFLQSSLCSRMSQTDFSWDDPQTFSELHVYASKHIITSIPALNKIFFEETVSAQTAGLPFPIIAPHILPQAKPLVLPEGALLEAVRAHHGFGKVDALSYRLTTPDGAIIAYSGDTGLCDGIRTIAQDADVFICEATARIGDDTQAHGYGHLTPFQTGEIAKQAGAKWLVLTHYIGSDSDSAMKNDCKKSGFAGKITIAKDGMKLKV